MSAPFRFKQFQVEQDNVPFKLGTDGCLLGAWTTISTSAQSVLDIGTGCGVIALQIAQRAPQAQITAIDIDSVAAQVAGRNFQHSPWAARMRAMHVSLQDFPDSKFDLIVSNPPYFSDSLVCPSERRGTARHTLQLSFRDLMRGVERLLSCDGVFSVVLPTDAVRDLLSCTILRPVRRCDVVTKPGVEPKRTLLELSWKHVPVSLQTLLIESEVHGDYTQEYRTLLRDFYLKF